MAIVQTAEDYNGFTIFDAQTWLPTYGFWCGPGWSAGERNSQKTREQLVQSPVFIHPDGTSSVIDQICKEHDIAYFDAVGKDDETRLVAEADLALLDKLSQVDFPSLPALESVYGTFMVFTFVQKTMMIDLPRVGAEIVMNRLNDLLSLLEAKLANLNGLTYTDSFGDAVIGSTIVSNVEGLSYFTKSVTYIKAAGGNAVFTHYFDAYQNTYSGFDSAYDPTTVGAFVKVWIDGTVSLIEGSRQLQLTDSSNGGTAPTPGSSATPVPGTGSVPHFFWNGLYVNDGQGWTYMGPQNWDAWVCVDGVCYPA